MVPSDFKPYQWQQRVGRRPQLARGWRVIPVVATASRRFASVIISLIDGAQRLPDDAHILASLRKDATRDPIFGAAVLIAVHNGQGEIYRLVQCHGMRQADSATQCLRALGFKETFVIGSPFHYTFMR